MGKCYCLKSGLSKRAVYQAIAAHNTIGSKLLAVKDCTFKRNHNFYWLRFFGEDCDYQICFHQSFGRYLVRFMKEEYWAHSRNRPAPGIYPGGIPAGKGDAPSSTRDI